MKRKVPFFLMRITGSNNLVGFTAVLYIHLARNGMLSLSLNCPLTPNPITLSRHLSFQKLFDLKNHEKRRKSFPKSCPLKVKDSVALTPWSNECMETFKIAKSKRNFPTFQKRPRFSVKYCSPLCGTNKNKQKAPEHDIFMCFCACFTGQQTPRNTLWNMCVYERDGWGCSQGYFRDLALASWSIPPLIPSLSYTHLPPHLFYR